MASDPILTQYDMRRCTEEAEHGQLTLPDRVLALARSHEALRTERDALREALQQLAQIGHESWKQPGHPMNTWVSRATVNRIADRALEAHQ